MNTLEVLMWTALIAVVIAAIAAGLQLLGVDVLNFVRDTIGI